MLVGDHIISWPYIFQKLIKVHISLLSTKLYCSWSGLLIRVFWIYILLWYNCTFIQVLMWRKVANISASIRPAVCQQKPGGLQPAPAPWQQDAWQPENRLPAEEERRKSPQSLAAQEVHHPRWHYASQSLWRKGH